MVTTIHPVSVDGENVAINVFPVVAVFITINTVSEEG